MGFRLGVRGGYGKWPQFWFTVHFVLKGESSGGSVGGLMNSP